MPERSPGSTTKALITQAAGEFAWTTLQVIADIPRRKSGSPARKATRAGKSTGAAGILPTRFPTGRFLNADDIARALATDSRIEAGKVINLAGGTLCGRRFLNNLSHL